MHLASWVECSDKWALAQQNRNLAAGQKVLPDKVQHEGEW